MLIRILLSICMLFALAHGESVKSITGNIIIDIDNDGTSEAKLTSNGFAIGDGLSPSANLHVQGGGIVTGDLVVGGTAGNSTLEIQGTMGYDLQTVSSNTTLSGNSLVMVDTSSDNITVTLPYAGNVVGREYTIKKKSTSNTITLNGGGNNIDSGTSYTFSSGNSSYLKVISNGIQWYVLDQSNSGITAANDMLYVYEGFDYAANTSLEGGGLNGGSGWSSGWDGTNNGTNWETNEDDTGLSYSTLPVVGISALREATNNRGAAYRPIDATTLTSMVGDGTTLWFSFLFNMRSSGTSSGLLFSNLNTDVSSSNPSLSNAGYSMGVWMKNDEVLYAAANNNLQGINVYSSSPTNLSFVQNTTYLFVGKINWKANGTNDELYIWNCTNLSTEPSEGSADASITTDFDQSVLDRIAIYSSQQSEIDEIRFGNSFNAVVGGAE